MFVGTADELADCQDNEWADSQMFDTVVYYHEWPLGHMSFMVGKDMSYFNEVLDLLAQYQPVTSTTKISQ
jgi:hypothetical protein